MQTRAIDLASSRFEFAVEDASAGQFCSVPGWDGPVPLSAFRSSYAESASLAFDGTDQFEQNFRTSELIAWIAYIRAAIGRAVNAPCAGAVNAFCGSLPEQWSSLAVADCVIRPPQWSLEVRAGSLDRVREGKATVIEDIYDPGLPVVDPDWPIAHGPRIVAERPRGALCACAFAGDTLAHRILRPSGPCSFVPPESVENALRATIRALRSSFGLDLGEIGYYYLDEPVFWSVAPVFSLDGLSEEDTKRLVRATAKALLHDSSAD